MCKAYIELECFLARKEAGCLEVLWREGRPAAAAVLRRHWSYLFIFKVDYVDPILQLLGSHLSVLFLFFDQSEKVNQVRQSEFLCLPSASQLCSLAPDLPYFVVNILELFLNHNGYCLSVRLRFELVHVACASASFATVRVAIDIGKSKR